jgi:hypothetical protein
METSISDRIQFTNAPGEVRRDITAAHARFWQRLAAAGTWWSGAERLAIAAQTRAALDCSLCNSRKEALSPNAISGEHDGSLHRQGLLTDATVDVIHRITSDSRRLGRTWFEKVQADGLGDTHYVELLGIVVAMISIDAFCRGLGTPLHPLPDPIGGKAPSRLRPASARADGAWVPMIPADEAKGSEADLWRGRAPNVFRAMSLVPDAVRDLKYLLAAHYVEMGKVGDPGASRTLSRPQIELIAGRVAALNECFY